MSQKGSNATLKQKKFADEYIKTGNATQAYMTVYRCNENSARANATRLIANDSIKEYMIQRNKKLEKSTIADMAEIKEYWTNILRADTKGVKGGLKASEYMAKTNAAFIDKIDANIKGDINITLEGEVKNWAK